MLRRSKAQGTAWKERHDAPAGGRSVSQSTARKKKTTSARRPCKRRRGLTPSQARTDAYVSPFNGSVHVRRVKGRTKSWITIIIPDDRTGLPVRRCARRRCTWSRGCGSCGLGAERRFTQRPWLLPRNCTQGSADVTRRSDGGAPGAYASAV